MNPTDMIVLFKPVRAAELIGNPDALTLLKIYWQKAADSAFQWAMNGDLSQPWCYADPSARGQVLVDYYSEEICALLHRYGEPKAHAYRERVKLTGFEGRQFHREEIARWLEATGIHSDYTFRLADDDTNHDGGTSGGTKTYWTKERAMDAYLMRQRLENEGCPNPMEETAKHFGADLPKKGVSTRRLREVFKTFGLR